MALAPMPNRKCHINLRLCFFQHLRLETTSQSATLSVAELYTILEAATLATSEIPKIFHMLKIEPQSEVRPRGNQINTLIEFNSFVIAYPMPHIHFFVSL